MDFSQENFNLKSYLDKTLKESKVQEAIEELKNDIQGLNSKIQEIILSKQGELISNSSFSIIVESNLEYKSQLKQMEKKFHGIKDKSLKYWDEMAAISKELQIEIQKSIISKGLIRFLSLYKRLSTSMDSGILQELNFLEKDLSQIKIVQEKLGEIQEYKSKKQEFASETLEKGLDSSSLQDIITGLGIFYNLNALESKVLEILSEVLAKIQEYVDNGLSLKNFHAINTSQAKSGVKRVNEPSITDSSSKLWVKELWKNVEKMTEEIYKECLKIYNLEKGLEAVGVECNQDVTKMIREKLQNTIGDYFWNNFATVLEKGIRRAIKGIIKFI